MKTTFCLDFPFNADRNFNYLLEALGGGGGEGRDQQDERRGKMKNHST